MVKGRRAKDDRREVKSSSVTTRITASQKEKLEWLSKKLRQSIADLLGSWIESVFDRLGGNLDAEPMPAVDIELEFLERLEEGRWFDEGQLVNKAAELGRDPEFLMDLQVCAMKRRGEQCKQMQG